MSNKKQVKNFVEGFKTKIFEKPNILTTEKEEQIRADERVKFARSFNFQSLFTSDDPPGDWKSWATLIFSILAVITIIWRT